MLLTTISKSSQKPGTDDLVHFIRAGLQQFQRSFVTRQSDFKTNLREELNALYSELALDAPHRPFLLDNCQTILGLGPDSLNQLLFANDLAPARFMGQPPPKFDCALVSVETASRTSGYIFVWEEELLLSDVYFLLAHAWGHLVFGHLRQGDEFSHWDSLADLRHPSGPARRWDQAVGARLSEWFEPLPAKPDLNQLPAIEWVWPSWAVAWERFNSNDFDEPTWSAIAASHHYLRQTLQFDFDQLSEAQLFPHQKRGAVELTGRLQRLGVALLADSVGLGKTRTTATLIRLLRQNGLIRQAAILTPQKLEHNWREEIQKLGLTIGVAGDTQADTIIVNKDKFKRWEIGRARREIQGCDLLVIEEAHQDLRNFGNKFHRNLTQVARGKMGLLVTATPWNNRRGDIFAMLYPFAVGTTNPERPAQIWACFNQSVKDGLRQFESNDDTFRQIYNLTTLQRTRRQLRESGEASVFYAPRRPYLIGVPYTPQQTISFANLLDKIQQLRLPHLNFLRYLAAEDTESELSGFQRFGLLKRAESSMYAFSLSLKAMGQKTTNFLQELRQLEDSPDAVSQWVRQRFSLEEQVIEQQSEEPSNREINPEVARPGFSAKRAARLLEKATSENRLVTFRYQLIHDCAQDLQIIRSLQQEFAALLGDDPKLKAIGEQVHTATAAGHKVLCISQYADTAWSVYDYLRCQPILAHKGVGLVTSGKREGVLLTQLNGQPASREEVLSRFAPHSWAGNRSLQPSRSVGAKLFPAEIEILVGSDTLSVGQNLQDARVLLNLDLCWNPMQHEQRIGRIDRPRPASDAAPLDIYYFLNLELIESELRLQATIERRLTATYQDTDFDDEVLPGYFDMIEQFRRLRQEQTSDKVLIAEANNVLEDIIERSAHPPQVQLPNSEVEREALLQLQTFANSYSTLELPPDFDHKALVTLGRITLQDRQGVVRQDLPSMVLAAELAFNSLDQAGEQVGTALYRHCYISLNEPKESTLEPEQTASEGWEINLEDDLIAPFIDAMLAPTLVRPLNSVQLSQLAASLSHLEAYAKRELDFQFQALKKALRIQRRETQVEVQPHTVEVRLANLKCLLL